MEKATKLKLAVLHGSIEEIGRLLRSLLNSHHMKIPAKQRKVMAQAEDISVMCLMYIRDIEESPSEESPSEES